MNADYFWAIMAACVIIALIAQIATDKRKLKKNHRK